MLGLCCVFWPEIARTDNSTQTLVGLGLSLVGTYFASLGNLVSVKLQARKIPVISSNAIGMGYGALISLVMSAATGSAFVFDTRPSYGISLFLLALFASAIAFNCYLTLVQRIGAGRAAYSAVLFPLVALTISTFLEGYHWTGLAVLGIVLVLCGNVIILRRGSLAAKRR